MHATISTFELILMIFILASFVGYYVVWRVTPALHAPLMSITNVVSSIIVVAALKSGIQGQTTLGQIFSSLSLFLVSVNIAGGLVITKRMLNMFVKK